MFLLVGPVIVTAPCEIGPIVNGKNQAIAVSLDWQKTYRNSEAIVRIAS